MNSFLRDWNPDLVVLIRIFRSNQDSTKISGFTHLSVSETLLARACIMMLTFSNWSLERPASSILFPSFRSSSSRFRTWTMPNVLRKVNGLSSQGPEGRNIGRVFFILIMMLNAVIRYFFCLKCIYFLNWALQTMVLLQKISHLKSRSVLLTCSYWLVHFIQRLGIQREDKISWAYSKSVWRGGICGFHNWKEPKLRNFARNSKIRLTGP